MTWHKVDISLLDHNRRSIDTEEGHWSKVQPLLILSIIDFATLSAMIFAGLATESEDVLSIDESKWSIKSRCVHLSLLCDLQIRVDL